MIHGGREGGFRKRVSEMNLVFKKNPGRSTGLEEFEEVKKTLLLTMKEWRDR